MDSRYDKIKEEFEAIAHTDNDGYRKFFLKYPYLGTNDFCQIVGLSAKTIRKRKKQAGLGSKNPPKPPQARPYVPPVVDLPEDWDNAEWWRAHYPKYGGPTLAKITGLNIDTVYKKLRKHGIKINSNRTKQPSTHPCCTKEWVVKHYQDKRMSIENCANLAGVSNETFTGWLNRFKVEIRNTRYGPSVG